MTYINTIIFDIGNVLVDFKWEQYLRDCGYNDEIVRKVSEATVKNDLWKKWDRGDIEEAEIIEQSCKLEPSVEREIRKLFVDIEQLINEFDYSAEIIKKLKENGYKVYLLSNYARSHYELDKKNFKFLDYVDGGIISYEVILAKPEPEIYKALIQKYNINPQEAVFLDDLPENLEAAKPFGFHTIQVKSYQQILEDLQKLGVNI